MGGSNGESPFGSPDYYSMSKENISRDAWQKPSEVLALLGDISDKVVADIGAGTGYFTFRMALKAKKVIAVEIDRNMIDLINAFKLNLPTDLNTKIQTRLASPNNSKLELHEADIIVMINTVTYIKDKVAYLKHLHQLLPEDGKIMIVDYKTTKLPITVDQGSYKLPATEMENLLEKTGFEDVILDENSLDYQYILIASR
jgi:predicted RNA methylase